MIADLLPAAELVPEEVQGKATGIPITEAELASLLASERVQIVRVVTRTLPKFHRGSPFKPRSVVSLCVRCGFIGADYLRVVETQRKREGIDLGAVATRCRPGRLWNGLGEHVAGNRHLVRHRQRQLLYLVLYPKTDYKGTPVESYREFFGADDLQPLDRELVQTWRVRSPGSNCAGTKKKIPWRLPCLGSITSITVGGTPYTIVGERSTPMSAETKRRSRGTKAASKKRSATSAETLPAECSPELLAAIRTAKLGEQRQAFELRTVKASGLDALGRLAIALNEAARAGHVVGIFRHDSSFVICLDSQRNSA